MLRRRYALVGVLLGSLAPSARAQHLETTRDVNLRKGPSTSSEVISVVDSGTAVDSPLRRKGWDRVQLAGGAKGWIYSHYLRPGQAPSPAPVPPPPPAPVPPSPGVSADTAPSSFHSCAIDGSVSPNGPNPARAQGTEHREESIHRAPRRRHRSVVHTRRAPQAWRR